MINKLSYSYEVYGLHICTNLELPGLQENTTSQKIPDIKVTLGSLPEDILDKNRASVQNYYTDKNSDSSTDQPHLVVNLISDGNYFHFKYDDGIQFVLDKQASKVWGTWEAPYDMDYCALYLLGPILGFMLRLRDITCLHASGIVIDDQVLAFCGFSGSGKSTLAAKFATRGYPVITDDVMPITRHDNQFFVNSGYPRLRLYPGSFKEQDELPRLSRHVDKCYLDLTAGKYLFHRGSLRLHSIYIFDWGKRNSHIQPKIRPISSGGALSLLAANTYRNELLDFSMKGNEFEILGNLVSKVPVKQLQPVNNILTLDCLVDYILDYHAGIQ